MVSSMFLLSQTQRTCHFPFAPSAYSRARFCFSFHPTIAQVFPLHNLSQGVTPGSNLEAATHTKTKTAVSSSLCCISLPVRAQIPTGNSSCTEMCADISRTSEASRHKKHYEDNRNVLLSFWESSKLTLVSGSSAQLLLFISYFLLPTESVSRPKTLLHPAWLLPLSLQVHSCPARTWTPAAI